MWILASRGRPQNFQRFINQWIITKASSQVYVRLDDCDPFLEEYKKIDVPPEFIINIGPRVRLVKSMNEIVEYYPNEQFYGLLADDLIPHTTYWDKFLITSAGLNKISQANDLTKKPKNCYHPCVGGDLVRTAGFFGFPLATHYCAELTWKELAKSNKNFLRYLPDVIVENAHPDYEKAQVDQTYNEAFETKAKDIEIWNSWFKSEFIDWRKKMMSMDVY